jgi:Ssp1 endopeptidase immunity protein Rap1a
VGSFNRGVCGGYVEGISDALGADNSINGYTACFPENVKERQTIEVVIQFLVANPATRHRDAAGLVAHALAEAFPCQR